MSRGAVLGSYMCMHMSMSMYVCMYMGKHYTCMIIHPH